MRIQYEILLLTSLVMSTSIGTRAQKLTENAPPKTALKPPKGMWLSLSAATYTAAALDMHSTADALEWFNKHPHYYTGPTETDPLAQPFVRLPRPAYYACGVALATGVNWLGYRMSRSRRWRKIWWLPQSISISANGWGYKTRQPN